MDAPLLSVCLITYNHEKYIREAIDGVLMQKVNFTWEFIIADDFSTDGTREIVLEYKEKYPDFIKLILQEKNVGASQNFIDLITAPKSKYIAYFEGDDYWTDPLKLQKQIDFLEANPEYAICFHPVNIIYVNTKKANHFRPNNQQTTTTIKDLLKKNFIHTSSAMLRNRIFDNFPDWFNKVKIGDWPLFLLVSKYGNIGFIPDVMSVYRKHSGGVWSNQKNIEKKKAIIEVYNYIENDLSPEYKKNIKDFKESIYYHLIGDFEQAGQISDAKKLALKCFINYPHYRKGSYFLIFLKYFFPSFFKFGKKTAKILGLYSS